MKKRRTDETKERMRAIRVSKATGRKRAQRENLKRMLSGELVFTDKAGK